jgi:hypothetical protein
MGLLRSGYRRIIIQKPAVLGELARNRTQVDYLDPSRPVP